MSQQQYNGPRRKVHQNALTEYKLRLFAPPHANASLSKAGNPKAPTLSITIKDNQPHLICRTNVEGDKAYGVINAGMDGHTFFAVMEAVKDASYDRLRSNGQPTRKVQFQCLGYIFPGGKRSDKPVCKNSVEVGRTDEGAVYIAVLENNRPNIQFIFGPSEWHQMVDETGNVCSIDYQAAAYARGYATLMTGLVSHLMVTEFKTEEEVKESREAARAQARGGNGGGGYNRNNNNNSGGGYNRGGGNGGGYNNNQNQNQNRNNSGGYTGDDFNGDDDIPF